MKPSEARFGAPVIEPPGSVARRRSDTPAPARRVPATVDSRWWRWRNVLTRRKAGTWTLPASQTLPRSFRIRSTIIRCSAASFSESRSAARAVASLPPRSRGTVPLIGADETRREAGSTSRNSSGEFDTTATPSISTQIA